MLSRAASRVLYVQPSGAASFCLSSLPRSSSTLCSSLSAQARSSSRRFATSTTSTVPNPSSPPPPPFSIPTPASATAASLADAASSTGGGSSGGGGGAGKQSFFKSDAWAKTVGTIGALANWSIPLAGITHIMSHKDPATTIDPVMTTSLAVYSLLFMRWAIAISPANYPLLVCHIANEGVQLTQLGRYAMADKKPSAAKQPQNVPLD